MKCICSAGTRCRRAAQSQYLCRRGQTAGKDNSPVSSMEMDQFPNVSTDLLEDPLNSTNCTEPDYQLLEMVELYLGR